MDILSKDGMRRRRSTGVIFIVDNEWQRFIVNKERIVEQIKYYCMTYSYFYKFHYINFVLSHSDIFFTLETLQKIVGKQKSISYSVFDLHGATFVDILKGEGGKLGSSKSQAYLRNLNPVNSFFDSCTVRKANDPWTLDLYQMLKSCPQEKVRFVQLIVGEERALAGELLPAFDDHEEELEGGDMGSTPRNIRVFTFINMNRKPSGLWNVFEVRKMQSFITHISSAVARERTKSRLHKREQSPFFYIPPSVENPATMTTICSSSFSTDVARMYRGANSYLSISSRTNGMCKEKEGKIVLHYDNFFHYCALRKVAGLLARVTRVRTTVMMCRCCESRLWKRHVSSMEYSGNVYTNGKSKYLKISCDKEEAEEVVRERREKVVANTVGGGPERIESPTRKKKKIIGELSNQIRFVTDELKNLINISKEEKKRLNIKIQGLSNRIGGNAPSHSHNHSHNTQTSGTPSSIQHVNNSEIGHQAPITHSSFTKSSSSEAAAAATRFQKLLQKELGEKRKEIRDLHARVSGLERILRESHGSLSEMKQNYSSQLQINVELRGLIQQREEELGGLLSAKESEIGEMKEKNTEMENKVKVMNEKMQNYQVQKTTMVLELKKKLQKNQKKLEMLQESFNETQMKSRVKFEKTLEEKNEEIRQLRNDLMVNNRGKEGLIRKVNNLQECLNGVIREKEVLESSKTGLKSVVALESMKSKNLELKRELEKREQEIIEVRLGNEKTLKSHDEKMMSFQKSILEIQAARKTEMENLELEKKRSAEKYALKLNEYKNDIAQIRQNRSIEIEQLKTKHANFVALLKEKHKAVLRGLERNHERVMEGKGRENLSFKINMEAELGDIRRNLELSITERNETIKKLRTERNEVKKRNKEMEEKMRKVKGEEEKRMRGKYEKMKIELESRIATEVTRLSERYEKLTKENKNLMGEKDVEIASLKESCVTREGEIEELLREDERLNGVVTSLENENQIQKAENLKIQASLAKTRKTAKKYFNSLKTIREEFRRNQNVLKELLKKFEENERTKEALLKSLTNRDGEMDELRMRLEKQTLRLRENNELKMFVVKLKSCESDEDRRMFFNQNIGNLNLEL